MGLAKSQQTSPNDAGRKRGSPFVAGEDGVASKRQAVGRGIDVEIETGTTLNDPKSTSESLQSVSLDDEIENIAETESPPEYDTCFGVVLARTTLNELASKPDGASLEVRVSGNLIRLYKEPGNFVDLFVSAGLGSLCKEFSVHMTATFVPETSETPKKGHSAKRGKASKALTPGPFTTGRLTRIVIYGLFTDKDPIGRHLSAAELYLQHPLLDEYDQSVEYYNPHLLLRPGSEMPRIEDLHLQGEEETLPGSDALDEVSQGKIWRIFDMASGGEGVPEVTPSPRLKTTLEKHQLTALEMMIEREHGVIKDAKFPTLWEFSPGTKNPRNKVTGRLEKNPAMLGGGILADEMGFGKTLSTLALICWHMDARNSSAIERAEGCSTSLVVAPKSTLLGWQSQIKRHIHDGEIKVTTYHGPCRHSQVCELVKYDVVLTTYEVLRQDFDDKDKRQTVYSHRWCRIVLDEAHRIRSRSTQVYRAALAVSKRSQFRWCLTGTPIHNSLDNYAALLSFLRVQGLQEKKQFDRFVSIPFKENEPHIIERLQALVLGTSLRRTIALNGEGLGFQSRVETIDFVDLSATDLELYKFFQEKSCRMAKGMKKGKGKRAEALRAGSERGDGNILSLILFLRFICNCGEKLLPKSALEAWKAQDMKVDKPMMQQLQKLCASCNASLRGVDDTDILPCGHKICSSCLLLTDDDSQEGERIPNDCSICEISPASDFSSSKSSKRSSKIEALIRNLRTERDSHGVVKKSVIFSCWTKMIDHVQKHLNEEGFIVERIDGQASLDQRRKAILRFKEEPDCTIMLASIGSAGEGIDLISACHVHILEPQWNPMSESQAIGRVHRFGQKQKVVVTRYIVNKSIETYIQWIQAEKLKLISKSIDQDSVSQEEVDKARWKRLQDTLSPDTCE
ncbi:hypothetical protein NM208_g4029 [Fusarium decemcellulare]|uniref:Uncharacterized protein n=2 Tax=Fusarium decemcellulare TaxID=57161 RepID=A0ACC1SM85_9HYPO|nr:hypothetical protein NM208_g4282 [Fusarium decemcellulare]KAJ3542561.1 hypothetical protein NM208_g4029 [Fusarium decemcellulare]